MFRLTIIISIVLVIIGISGYSMGTPDETGEVSLTALIPAFFGFAFAFLAWLALHRKIKQLAINLAIFVSLAGAIGSGLRIPVTYAKYTDGAPVLAFICTLLMSTICSIYLIALLRFMFIKTSLRGK
jgi:amino acid transporter